ncbi:hypothetical protein [Streptomyces dubilierae]|uniref:Uncharacterized protein n=1 Tax=Streptomyces dubilierae TaxID=3075533 RepID=A0ABU2PL94_9ACTN|nr:hypothetical protein [Streptomyces sp. DSM 41921]MDT0392934.1 hypothetical protein [Streptomyces sp. DSM 41921]
MSVRPELARPDDAAIQAAMDHALTALSAVFEALGDGTHTLNFAVERTDDAFVTGRADLCISTDSARLAVVDDAEFYALSALLVFALEGSTVRRAVLIATTAAEQRPRACGWSVREGWLHPMNTDDVRRAVTPCPGVNAVQREVYPAPPLPRITDTGEESRHG